MNHLANEVRVSLMGVFAALVISSILTIAIAWRSPNHDFSELRSRVKTWWAIVGLFSITLIISPQLAVWFLAFVSFLALKEFLSMTPTRRSDRRVLFYAYLAVIGQYYFASIAWYGMFIVFIPVVMFVWLPTRMMMIGQTKNFLRAAGTLHWALMVTVFSLSHAALLLVFAPSETPRLVGEFTSSTAVIHPGPGLLLFLLLMTELNAIFQYVWGKSFGRHKVAPTISPGKTYEGAIGGIVTTIGVACLLGPYLTLMDLDRSLLAGALIGLAGLAGDLSISAIKRDLNIKNFGATLPGHGGVLDRVDSLIFTAPLFFHFVFYMYG